MDVTKEVCEVSPSIKRMVDMLSRHDLELVIGLKDIRIHQPDLQSHGNLRDNVHPTGGRCNNREVSSPSVTGMFNYEYLIDSREFMLSWTERDELSFAQWFGTRYNIRIRSCSRKANLFVGQIGVGNLWYVGTIVAVHVYNSNSWKPILILAKSAKFTDLPLDNVLEEMSIFLPRIFDKGLYVLYQNSFDQYELEKWR